VSTRVGSATTLKVNGFGVGQQPLVLGHLDRIVRELAGGREVEVVFERLGAERLQLRVDAARVAAVQHGDRAQRHLQQHVQFLRRRGRVGHDDLAPVHHVDQELVRDELVQPLVVFEAVAVAVAEEVLADQDRRRFGHRLDRLDLFVERDQGRADGQRHGAVLELRFVLLGSKRQVQDGQGEHHLGEVARCFGQVYRAERRLTGRIMLRVVAPERVHGNQFGRLLFDGQAVVMVLDPFLGLVQLLIQLPDASAQFRLAFEKLLDCLLGLVIHL
jgi:hypothetical protein